MTPPETQAPLGLAMTTSLVIGTMIGAGIFILPASLAPLGWNAVLGWVISGTGALALAMTLRFLMQDSGEGFHHVIERVLGPVPAFMAVWALWTAGLVSIAALSIGGGGIFAEMVFDDPPQWIAVAATIGSIAFVTAVNLAGARSAGWMQIASVLIKLLPLVIVIGIVVVFFVGNAPVQRLAPAPITFSAIAMAAALTLFPLLGFESAVVPAQKIRNPALNIPIAMIGGTLTVVLIYIVVSTGIVLITPWQETAQSASPVSDLLEARFGPVAGIAVAICVLVSVTGCNNGLMLMQGECSRTMAHRGEIPAFMGYINTRGVPHWGILLTFIGAVALILANTSRGMSGLFTFLVLLTSGGVLVFYAIGLIAAIKVNRNPARWVVFALAGGFVCFAAYGTGLESMIWVWLLMASGLAVRWLSRRRAPTELAVA